MQPFLLWPAIRSEPCVCRHRFSIPVASPDPVTLALSVSPPRHPRLLPDAIFGGRARGTAVTPGRDSKVTCLSAFSLPGMPMWLRIYEMAVSWALLWYSAAFSWTSMPGLGGYPLLRFRVVRSAAWESVNRNSWSAVSLHFRSATKDNGPSKDPYRSSRKPCPSPVNVAAAAIHLAPVPSV